MPAFRFLWLLLAASACAPGVQDETPAAETSSRASPESKAAEPVPLTRPAPEGADYHAVRLDGTLTLEDGCFYVRTPGLRFLLIWPDGTRWDAADRVILFRNQRLRIGQRVAVNGDTGLPSADFDLRGCDATKSFRVNPWRAELLDEAPAPAPR
jgi:hypothetical protein